MTEGFQDLGSFAFEANKISKSFRQGDGHVNVLEDVSFTLERGKMVAVLGSSGSGKSTLLNIMGLLTSPGTGQIVVDGKDVSGLSSAQRAAFRLGRIAFVFQAFHLIEHKTVAENIELPLVYGGVPKDKRRQEVDRVLSRLGIEHRRNSLPATLSGGEKQRVAIARALVTHPTLLLCDEPTGSLDSARSREVIQLLREVTGPDQSTVIVTHDSWVAEQCDGAIRISDGKVVFGASQSKPPLDAPKFQPHSGKLAHWFGLGLREALHASVRRARRNAFTMLGVALGVASLVLTVGFSATISAQLSDRFNLYLSQRVSLAPPPSQSIPASEALEWQSSAGIQRLNRLNGVTAAGVVQEVSAGGVTVSLTPERRRSFEGRIQAPVMAVGPSGLRAMGLELVAGRFFDEGHMQRQDQVIVVGETLMRSLGRSWEPGLNVFVNNRIFTVIGVAREDLSATSALASVYLPLGQGLEESEAVGRTSILLKTNPGAASQVAREAGIAWDPTQSSSLTAAAPPEPATLKQAVDTQQRDLMIGMAAVTLLIGGVGTMNTFMVAVMERRREIGLRMALGSTPGGMMAQFAAEAILSSAAGAVLGVVAAINILAAVCIFNRWVPIISAESIGLGLVSGLLIGLLAGVNPARRAARTDPVETLSQN